MHYCNIALLKVCYPQSNFYHDIICALSQSSTDERKIVFGKIKCPRGGRDFNQKEENSKNSNDILNDIENNILKLDDSKWGIDSITEQSEGENRITEHSEIIYTTESSEIIEESTEIRETVKHASNDHLTVIVISCLLVIILIAIVLYFVIKKRMTNDEKNYAQSSKDFEYHEGEKLNQDQNGIHLSEIEQK